MRIFKDPTGNIFAAMDFFTLQLPKHIPLLHHLYVSASAESSAHKNAESISAKDSLLVSVRTRNAFLPWSKAVYESFDC